MKKALVFLAQLFVRHSCGFAIGGTRLTGSVSIFVKLVWVIWLCHLIVVSVISFIDIRFFIFKRTLIHQTAVKKLPGFLVVHRVSYKNTSNLSKGSFSNTKGSKNYYWLIFSELAIYFHRKIRGGKLSQFVTFLREYPRTLKESSYCSPPQMSSPGS